MKILFITNHYYPKIEPNAKRITGLAENLAILGNEVSVITSDIVTESVIINGVKIYKKKTTGKFSKGKISRLLNHVSFFVKTAAHNKKENEYDFVISTSPSPFNFISGYILSRRNKALFLLDIRDIWPEVFSQIGIQKQSSITYRFFDYLSNWSYKKARAILTVSPRKVKLLADKEINKNREVFLVSNGYDESFLNQSLDENFSREFNKEESKYNVIYFGNIGIAQDLKPFVKALKRLSHLDIMFHVIGDGNRLDNLKKYSESIAFKKIKYYGKRSYNEVYTALILSDFTYVSLGSDLLMDSVPTKLYEAIAMGVPIILSATGDASDLVENSKLGISVPVDHSDKLDIIIEDFVENINKYKSNAPSAKEAVVKMYSREAIAIELNEILEKILKENANFRKEGDDAH